MTETSPPPSASEHGLSRRDFLRSSAGAAVAASVAGRFGLAHAQGSDEIRVGLIGAGGRGTGALRNVLDAAPNVRVVAIGDVFQDQIDAALEQLGSKLPRPLEIPKEHQFTGLDAYRGVLAQDINYVILATPPGFRPLHLKAAVEAGKHIFTEKPVAVDGPGVREVLALVDVAGAKGLKIAAGTQRRHQAGYIETIRRIHDGAIGEIVAARAYWNQGGLWHKPRQPGWSDAEWMLRNWLYFPFLSGDIIVEQHVHNLDVVNWAMRAHPVRAVGLAGRQVRTQPEFGSVYDHFATDFEYGSGAHLTSMCRQIEGCANTVGEFLAGTQGGCQADRHAITGAHPWRYPSDDDETDPYVQEHADLIAAIRGDTPLNELGTVAEATLTGIMGRMAGYTGQAVSWEEALDSQERLMPANFDLDASIPVPAVAVPGQTPLT